VTQQNGGCEEFLFSSVCDDSQRITEAGSVKARNESKTNLRDISFSHSGNGQEANLQRRYFLQLQL